MRYEIRVLPEWARGDDVHAAVSPTDLDSIRALWASLPADLCLALAKTAPKVAGPWVHYDVNDSWARWSRDDDGQDVCIASVWRDAAGAFHAEHLDNIAPEHVTLAEAQAACDAELLRQGFVLEDSP